MRTLERAQDAQPASRPPRGDPQRRVLLVVGLLIAAFLVFFPTRQLVDQHIRMRALETRLDALHAENRQLERQLETLSDESELELVARERLGLVRPGEQVYVLVPEATPEPDPPVPATPWWRTLWQAVVDLVRGDRPT